MATAFVPKETQPGETRVALVADGVKRLAATGLAIQVEAGAGLSAGVADADYEKVGAKIVGPEASTGAWSSADLVLKVQPPTLPEAARLKSGAVLVSFVYAIANRQLADLLVKQ